MNSMAQSRMEEMGKQVVKEKLEYHLSANFNYPFNDPHIIYGIENEIQGFLRNQLGCHTDAIAYRKWFRDDTLHLEIKVSGTTSLLHVEYKYQDPNQGQ